MVIDCSSSMKNWDAGHLRLSADIVLFSRLHNCHKITNLESVNKMREPKTRRTLVFSRSRLWLRSVYNLQHQFSFCQNHGNQRASLAHFFFQQELHPDKSNVMAQWFEQITIINIYIVVRQIFFTLIWKTFCMKTPSIYPYYNNTM